MDILDESMEILGEPMDILQELNLFDEDGKQVGTPDKLPLIVFDETVWIWSSVCFLLVFFIKRQQKSCNVQVVQPSMFAGLGQRVR